MRAELPQFSAELANFSREDIAAGAQRILEEIVVKYITYNLQVNGFSPDYRSNVCLAGGLFSNVLLNKSVLEIDCVGDVFIFPHMGDGGLAAGGAAYAALAAGDSIKPLTNLYLGPTPFSSSRNKSQITAQLISDGFLVKSYSLNALAEKASSYLKDGYIVGLCQNRMEFGPRALGNRSILANPCSRNVTDQLNNRLRRSDFMPFAPVVTSNSAKALFCLEQVSSMPARYMTSCYACNAHLVETAPAIVHIDGTARPQIIDNDSNPLCYKIVSSFQDKTGIPALINTSLNMHESPIVCSADDAIAVLQSDALDALIIDDLWITKA